MSTTLPARQRSASKYNPWPAALLLFGAALAAFFVARFAGQWMDGDTLVLSDAILSTQRSGALAPAGASYQHGYGYPAVSVAVLEATGLSLAQLQTQVFPFVAMTLVGLLAFALYHQLLGAPAAAALAVLLLLLQGDFLFVTLRGSHEKLDWPLMMLALLLLHRSLGQPPRRLAVYLLLFYGVLYAMVTVNVFFGTVFLTAVSVSLGFGLLLGRLRGSAGQPRVDLRRLLYVVGSGGILVYVFLAYLYPPALANLRLLRTIVEQVSALFLSFEVQAQPYSYIDLGWVSRPVYLGLTAFTWVLIAASMAVWLRRGWQLLRGRQPFDLPANLDWLLYAGFAIQVGVSIVIDFAGVLGANLQLRIFPGFTVLAAVMLARGLHAWITRPSLSPRAQHAIWMLTGLAAAWFAGAAVLKASNDPLFSNRWGFYTSQEAAGLVWADAHLAYSTLWAGFDDRLSTTFDFLELGQPASSNTIAVNTFKSADRDVLISAVEYARGQRLRLALPAVIDWIRFYDSGQVQLYHQRPQTPFQH